MSCARAGAGRVRASRAGSVLGPTHGIPLYEEDVMGMAAAVAGIDLGAADAAPGDRCRRPRGAAHAWSASSPG